MRLAKFRLFPLLIAVSLTALLGGCGSGQSPQAQLHKAQQYEASGKIHAALVELRSLVKKHPKNSAGRLALGTLLLNIGDPASAAAQLQQAQSLGAAAADVELPLARALIQTRHYKQALATLHPKKARSAKQAAELLAARAEAQMRLKQFGKAKHSLAVALQKDPKLARAIADQASLALLQQHIGEAIKKADLALTIDPKNGIASMVNGMALYQQRHFSRAETYLKKALAAGSPQLSPNEQFFTRGRLAQTQIQAGQKKAALRNIDVLLKEAPKEPYANYLRGLLAYQAKHYQTAVEHFQTTLNTVPYDVRALTLIGSAEAQLGHDVLASNYLTSALAQSPHNPPARHLLAALQMRSGQSQQALDTLFGGGRHVSAQELLSIFPSPAKAVKTLLTLQTETSKPAQRAAIDLALARAFLTQGNTKRALTTLGAVKGAGLSALDAQRLTAAAYLHDGNRSAAIKVANDMAHRYPHNIEALHLASIIMLAAGSNTRAVSILRQAAKASPADIATYNALGAVLLREGRIKEAVAAFKHALHQAPDNLIAQLSLARIAAHRGDSTKALAWLEKAHNSNPKAVAPLVILSRYQLATGHPKQAVVAARQAAMLSRNAPAVLEQLGQAQTSDHQYKAALATFKMAAAAAPRNPHYLLAVAGAQLTLHEPKAAQATLRGIISKYPAFLPGVRALAFIQLRTGATKAAFATVDKLAAQPNAQAPADILRGDLYVQQKRLKKARTAYLKSFRSAPSQEAALKAFATGVDLNAASALTPLLTWLKQHPQDVIARINLASYYQQSGKLGAATDQYQKSLKFAPNNPVILNNLAYLVGLKDIARALQLAAKANRLAPLSPQIMDTYGWLLVRDHRAARALPLLKKAAGEMRGTPQIQYHFAQALADTGQRQKAASVLEAALGKNKNFAQKAAAEALLKQVKARG